MANISISEALTTINSAKETLDKIDTSEIVYSGPSQDLYSTSYNTLGDNITSINKADTGAEVRNSISSSFSTFRTLFSDMYGIDTDKDSGYLSKAISIQKNIASNTKQIGDALAGVSSAVCDKLSSALEDMSSQVGTAVTNYIESNPDVTFDTGCNANQRAALSENRSYIIDLKAAVPVNYSYSLEIPIGSSNWTYDSTEKMYYAIVEAENMTELDVPIATIDTTKLSSENLTNVITYWKTIESIETLSGAIKIISPGYPSTSFTVLLNGTRIVDQTEGISEYDGS